MSYPVDESSRQRKARAEAIQRFVRYLQMLAASGTSQGERHWLLAATEVIECVAELRLSVDRLERTGLGMKPQIRAAHVDGRKVRASR